MNLRKYIGVIFIMAVGCQTPQKYDSLKSQGQWEAKAQIKDYKNNKQHQVSLDFIGVWPNSLRTEVTGPLGISLASLVLKKDQISFMLPQQKKYYYGTLTDAALAPLFQIELNPHFLLNMCFDRPIDEKNWDCSRDEQGRALQCIRKTDQLTITWKDREAEQKRVVVSHKDFEVQILYKKFKPLVQISDSTFTLKPADDFRRYKLE